jgi:circadian clock protein KaiC
MPDRDFVKTGIRGLDLILGGGIPRGNTILVEGAAGTGKTTLGVEFIYRGASEFDEPGLIILFEVSPDKVIRDAAHFGWDLRQLEREGRLKIVFTTRQIFQQEVQQADSLLLEEAAQIGARRIFVDGIGQLAAGANGNGPGPREAFHVLAEGLQRENLTAMLSLETTAHEEARLIATVPEQFIADTVLLLRIEPIERGASRSIEVVKSRGHEFQLGRHTLRIADGRGLEVYRRVQAPRRLERETAAAFDLTTRLTTGVPGLDPLIGGGYWLGATILVVGVSGTGKSVMGLQYMAEGARRGEKSLMVTLDEPAAQVVRNAQTIGIDLQAEIDRGLIHLWYDSPQELEVDRHFARLEELFRTVKPRRVLIDSLSTYSAALGDRGRNFRDFLHAVVSLNKEYQATAVYNHENPQILGMSSMMGDASLSSLTDTIILMNWIELGDTFRLGLTVAKMRASPISRVTHECEITNGKGMMVLPRPLMGVGQTLPFSSYLGLVSRAPERHALPTDAPPAEGVAAAPKARRRAARRREPPAPPG